MKSRDLALVAILLAIGAVVYAFTPNMGVITPDNVVTFAVLAILLVRPKVLTGTGIGIVAGVIAMFFSKSPIAWFNIVVHAVGATIVAVVVLKVGDLKTGPISWKPLLAVLAYGIPGGGLFITAMLVMGMFPFQVYVTAGWTQVLLSTLASAIIDMILYLPAKKLWEQMA